MIVISGGSGLEGRVIAPRHPDDDDREERQSRHDEPFMRPPTRDTSVTPGTRRTHPRFDHGNPLGAIRGSTCNLSGVGGVGIGGIDGIGVGGVGGSHGHGQSGNIRNDDGLDAKGRDDALSLAKANADNISKLMQLIRQSMPQKTGLDVDGRPPGHHNQRHHEAQPLTPQSSTSIVTRHEGASGPELLPDMHDARMGHHGVSPVRVAIGDTRRQSRRSSASWRCCVGNRARCVHCFEEHGIHHCKHHHPPPQVAGHPHQSATNIQDDAVRALKADHEKAVLTIKQQNMMLMSQLNERWGWNRRNAGSHE